MYLRVLLLIGLLATRLLLAFAIIILPALIIAWAAGFWLYRRAPKCDAPTPPGNPIAILPFLPNGTYGPLGAWNPQKLWLVVVLVTGFSFLGYVANRIFGERHV